MKRENVIGYTMLIVGFAVIVVMLFSLSARAAEEPTAQPIGPVMESGKDLADDSLSMPRIEPKAGELTREMEKPMRVPETIHETTSTGYRPLCGPAKNAINHVYCGEGYDVFAF